MEGPAGGGNNMPSNPMNTLPRVFKGYIRGITTQTQLNALTVQIASTGTQSAQPPRPCTNLAIVTLSGTGETLARYQCTTQPNTTHQIVPTAAQTAFVAPVLNLPVLNNDTGPNAAAPDLITASTASTYNIGGRVTASGQPLAGMP